MKPFFSYYGGKQRMANKIIPLIPKHTVYCEPFAGGASILFMKPYPDTYKTQYIEVINDLNCLVYNFYEQLRNNPEELQRLINCTIYCEKTHTRVIEICKQKEIINPLESAWAFFTNISTSFAKKLNGGWGRSVIQKESAQFNSKIENLNKFLYRMKDIHVSNAESLKCIEQWDSPQTFFYLDPPYVGTDQGHYSGYKQEDLNNLIELLKTIDGSFILSGYDNDNYPDDWERFEFESAATSCVKIKKDKSEKSIYTNDIKRKEIVLRHITKKSVRPEIKKLYSTPAFQCFTGRKTIKTVDINNCFV